MVLLESLQIRRGKIEGCNDPATRECVVVRVDVGGRPPAFALLGPALQDLPVSAQEKRIANAIEQDARVHTMIKAC